MWALFGNFDCGRVLFGSRVAETRSRGHSAVTALMIRHDDWDVYYERGRKTKESKTKDEAARSEGDYRGAKVTTRAHYAR